MGEISKATPGSKVEWPDGRVDVVQEPCSGDIGNWVCISCKKVLQNNFDKDIHIAQGNHTLAWNCHEHGLEKP